MENDEGSKGTASAIASRWIAATSSRGFLLDLFAFGLNVAAMAGMSRAFNGLVRQAAVDDQGASQVLLGMAVALFVLAPLGATLSRWHFHQRRAQMANSDQFDAFGGCFFNPIFYFCLTALIFSVVNAAILQTVYGRNEPNETVFLSSIFIGLSLMILHTVLVYRYFSPPKGPPKSSFFRGRISAVAGDVCLFLNMAIFQLIWNLLGAIDVPAPSGLFDFVARASLLMFLALLLYFPPRIFYLAEDIGKSRTWAMMLLANSPILARFLLGWGSNG